MRLKKSTILFTKYLLILSLLLTPQRAFSQFSDTTIKEINLRLLELHKCRQKQSLYVKLAANDSLTIQDQHSQIIELKNANFDLVGEVKKYKTFAIISWSVIILALII